MITIYKYKVQPDLLSNTIKIKIPINAQILTFAEQNNEIYLWAKVDATDPMYTRNILVVGTGFNLDSFDFKEWQYVSTVHMKNGLVFHFFENIS